MRPVPYGGRSTTPSGTSPQGDAGALAKFLVSYFWMVNAVALIILKYGGTYVPLLLGVFEGGRPDPPPGCL